MKPKFVIGGLVIAAVIIFLIVFSTKSTGQYYLTLAELVDRKEEMLGKRIRISGVVLQDTISYDAKVPLLQFQIAYIPSSMKEVEAMGGLDAVLAQAASDATLPRVWVEYHDVKPDLLKPGAQAILTGSLKEDGIFYADELLLKCPSKYESQK